MRIETSFEVPLPVGETWTLLQDIERIAHWFPGARLDEVEDDVFRGTVRVKLGPMLVDYKGAVRFTERDEQARRVVIEASGREARGAGTAKAKAVTSLRPAGEGTDVAVAVELEVTGRPAQLGQGLMQEVAERLVGEFSKRMEAELTASGQQANRPPSEPGGAGGRPDAGQRAGDALAVTHDDDVLDLGLVAGPAMVKRLLPLAAAAIVLLLARRWHRRHRRPH